MSVIFYKNYAYTWNSLENNFTIYELRKSMGVAEPCLKLALAADSYQLYMPKKRFSRSKTQYRVYRY